MTYVGLLHFVRFRPYTYSYSHSLGQDFYCLERPLRLVSPVHAMVCLHVSFLHCNMRVPTTGAVYEERYADCTRVIVASIISNPTTELANMCMFLTSRTEAQYFCYK